METNENRSALVAGLVEIALVAKLDGADWASRYGISWLCEAYNGIGP